jgi:hypothetical protein
MYRLQNGFTITSIYNSKYAWLEADGYIFEIHSNIYVYDDIGDLIIKKRARVDIGVTLTSDIIIKNLSWEYYLTVSPDLSLTGINRCESIREALSELMVESMYVVDREEVLGNQNWTYPEDGRDTDRNYLGKYNLSRNIYGNWMLKED